MSCEDFTAADKPAVAYGWSSASEHFSHDYLWFSIKNLLTARAGLTVLDAGCGCGFLANKLAELGYSVTAIDSSADGIELGRTSYPSVRFEKRSVYDDLTDLMPPDGWDVVISAEVIEHLYSPVNFLNNIFLCMNNQGSLIITTPYHGFWKNLALSLMNRWDSHFTVGWEGGHIKFFSEKTLTKMLSDAGFSDPLFRNAGRMPGFWKSIVCRAEKANEAPLRACELLKKYRSCSNSFRRRTRASR